MAACAAAAASFRRSSPAEDEPPDADRREDLGAAGEEPQRVVDHRAVTRLVRRGVERVAQRQVRRSGRLGQHLGVVELEAAAEREPARRQDEGAAAPALARERRDAHGRTRARGPLGPHERQPEHGRPLGRGELVALAGGGVGDRIAAVERVAQRGSPVELREEAVDPLRGEVGRGGHQIEVQGRTCARPHRPAPVGPAAASCIQRDDLAHAAPGSRSFRFGAPGRPWSGTPRPPNAADRENLRASEKLWMHAISNCRFVGGFCPAFGKETHRFRRTGVQSPYRHGATPKRWVRSRPKVRCNDRSPGGLYPHRPSPQASPVQPVGPRRSGAGPGGRQVDPPDHPRPRRRSPPVRRAPARPPRHLDRAAPLPAEPHGRRRAADPPALPRGAAARGLRAHRARPRPAAGHRRPRGLGFRVGVGPAERRRGDRHRRDLPRPSPGSSARRPTTRGLVELVVMGTDGEPQHYAMRVSRGSISI